MAARRLPPTMSGSCVNIGRRYRLERMKPISVHVDEQNYRDLKRLAHRRGQPVAELVREAMSLFLDRERDAVSLLSIAPLDAGTILRGFDDRSEIWDEMVGARWGEERDEDRKVEE